MYRPIALTFSLLIFAPAQAVPLTSLENSNATPLIGSAPRISGDGRFVVFDSPMENLVAEDGNGVRDVFQYDAQSGLTRRVSTTSGGGQANGPSRGASMSSDGRFVAFTSNATNLAASDAQPGPDLFVKDLLSGDIEHISRTSAGIGTNDVSSAISISGNGRFVVYVSASDKLTEGDDNSSNDVFLFDRENKTTRLISGGHDGQDANGPSAEPHISQDGNWLAFSSYATNLDAQAANLSPGGSRVYLRDLTLNITRRIASDDLYGEQFSPRLSADGRHMVFSSRLHPISVDVLYELAGDRIHLYERDIGLVSTPPLQLPLRWGLINCEEFIGGDCRYTPGRYAVAIEPTLSPNGRFIGFSITDQNTILQFPAAPWPLGFRDVFVYDRDTNSTTEVSVHSHGSGTPDVSDNGNVVFGSSRDTVYAREIGVTVDFAPTSNDAYLYLSDKPVRRLGLPRWYTRDLPFFAPQEPINGIAPDAIEVPRYGEVYYGVSVLRGWRLSGDPVDLYIDEKRRLTLNTDGKRGDVTQAADLPPDRGVGWSLAFNMGLLQPGWHVLELRDPLSGQTLARQEFISDALPFYNQQGERIKFVTGLEQLLTIVPSTETLDYKQRRATLRWDTPKQGWSIFDYSGQLSPLLDPAPPGIPPLAELTPPAVPATAIEVPAANEIHYGIVNLRGWRLSGEPILVCFDQSSCHPLAADGKRGDVAEAAFLPPEQGVGWAMAYNVGLLQPGKHIISLYDGVSGEFLRSQEFFSGRLPYTDSLGNTLPYVRRTPQEISIPGALPGHRAMLQWRDATQGYEIIDYHNPEHPQTPPTMIAIPAQSVNVGGDFFLPLSDYTLSSEGEDILGYRADGPLPPGLMFDTTFGVFTGKPRETGAYSVPVRAWDNDGWSNSRILSILVH